LALAHILVYNEFNYNGHTREPCERPLKQTNPRDALHHAERAANKQGGRSV